MTSKPVKRASGFSRDAHGFMDPKKEAFAKAWATTGLLVRACEAADVVISTGAKWRGTPEMVTRIRELRAGAQTFVGASKATIANMLRENAENAAAQGKFKESNESLGMLYKLMSSDADMKDGTEQASGGVSADMTPAELDDHRKKVFKMHALPAPKERELAELERDEEWQDEVPVFGGVDEL